MIKNKKILYIELLFSLLIIIFTFVIITFLCLKMNEKIEIIIKNNEASNISTNIFENINSRTYDNISEYIQEFSGVGVTKKLDLDNQNIVIDGNLFNDTFFSTKIPNGYILEFNSENPSEDFDITKYITLNIKYKINNNEKKFEISTVIEKENIEECNRPIISEAYFTDLGFNSDDYEFVPIKYSETNNSYIVTSQNDVEWYNYSSKKWAKILVFSVVAENIRDLFIDENGIVKNEVIYGDMSLNVNNYIYVWIPNFSIKDNISYFRYGTSKRAIRLDFQYMNNKYLYTNRVSEEMNDISADCSFNGIFGVWRKLDDNDDPYYMNFNKTKFAPINLY